VATNEGKISPFYMSGLNSFEKWAPIGQVRSRGWTSRTGWFTYIRFVVCLKKKMGALLGGGG
jgi:hypothetical protein